MQIINIKCTTCVHMHVPLNKLTCDAFVNSIPIDIINGVFDHSKRFKGDNGIIYKKAKIVTIDKTT